MELKFYNLESSKIALEKELDSKSRTAKDFENKNVKLEKDLLAFKMENNVLTENIKDLEFDIKKIKGDYNEYQEKFKELGLERTVVEKINLKKEERKLKRSKKDSKKLNTLKRLLRLRL